jgi:imidazolonepropionase-like amidohydrolase
MKSRIVFRSARIFDGETETLRATDNVVVEAGVISVSGRPPLADDEVVDCAGRVLMPGRQLPQSV